MKRQEEEALTKLHKDILGGIKDDLLEVLANQDLDRVFVPVVGDVLAHEMGLWGQLAWRASLD